MNNEIEVKTFKIVYKEMKCLRRNLTKVAKKKILYTKKC